VLIDGIGRFYGGRDAFRPLRRSGLNVASFLPPRLFPPQLLINLRNHRKILVTDGELAFTGGMNISVNHLADDHSNPDRVKDLHCRIRGPIVRYIERAFREDWQFVTEQRVELVQPSPEPVGTSTCRAIFDGPNEDIDKLETVLIGAISTASTRVSIMTPYFLPSREMIGSLKSAALRGVDVSIVLPDKSDHRFINWATRHSLGELLERGVKIYFQPAPFVHTKLFVVDDHYAQIGSANIDPRSLKLNFEFAVEVYDAEFAREVSKHVGESIAQSRVETLESVRSRSWPAKLRDAAFWLASPCL